MTRPIGISPGMDPFALDTGTAERLVTGAVDAADAPPEYRGVARTLRALRADRDHVEWAGESVAVERIAAVVVVHRRSRRTRRARRARLSSSRAGRIAAVTAVVGAVCLTGGFASAGSLPKPAQNAAQAVLGTVGISVPNGGEEPAPVHEPPTTIAGTAPPGATSPPSGSPPGAARRPAVPTSPAFPEDGSTGLRDNQGKDARPGKAHDNGPWTGDQPGHNSDGSQPGRPGEDTEH